MRNQLLPGDAHDLLQGRSDRGQMGDLLEDAQSHAGDGTGVQGDDLPVRIAILQRLDGDAHGVEGRGQAGGEVGVEDVVAALERRLEQGDIVGRG